MRTLALMFFGWLAFFAVFSIPMPEWHHKAMAAFVAAIGVLFLVAAFKE